MVCAPLCLSSSCEQLILSKITFIIKKILQCILITYLIFSNSITLHHLQIAELVSTGVCAPLCPSSCEERLFTTEVTSSLWPRKSIVAMKKIGWEHRIPAVHDLDLAHVQHSVLMLNVYLKVVIKLYNCFIFSFH